MRDRLLAFFDPNRSIAFFVVGTAALTVAVTVMYDTVKESLGLWGAWGLALVLVAVAVAAIAYQILRRRVVGRVGISEEMKPKPRRGLILLVSPHIGTARHAIEYHLGTLQACWLVASPDSLKVAEQLHDKYRDRIPYIAYGTGYTVEADEVEDTYTQVLRIYEQELPQRGLKAEEVIADITGGQKPMTAGMALACLAKNLDMQYMKARRNERGEPDRSVPPEPVKIDTTFIPSSAP
ncbi:MAG: hypothetical protein ACE5IG_07930 [Dehalococcoidia bacterium]